jgi:hypothetical protein
MIPVFSNNLVSIGNLSFVQSAFFWLYAVLGTVAIMLGLIIIFSWGNSSFGRTWVFKNVETNDTHFRDLGFCISSGSSNTYLQHNLAHGLSKNGICET